MEESRKEFPMESVKKITVPFVKKFVGVPRMKFPVESVKEFPVEFVAPVEIPEEFPEDGIFRRNPEKNSMEKSRSSCVVIFVWIPVGIPLKIAEEFPAESMTQMPLESLKEFTGIIPCDFFVENPLSEIPVESLK